MGILRRASWSLHHRHWQARALALRRAFPDRLAGVTDVHMSAGETKKISRPPSAPPSPRLGGRHDLLHEDSDGLADRLSQSRLDDEEEEDEDDDDDDDDDGGDER